MQALQHARTISKDSVLAKIAHQDSNAFAKYTSFFIGISSVPAFLRYEILTTLLAGMPGAAGLLFRKKLYPSLFHRVGSDVVWGRNISLRHPGRISIGDRVGIDDNCLIDARGADEEGIQIGSDVLIARDSIIQAKTGPIHLGDRVTIGSQCQFASISGIKLGDAVMVGGQSYIGGGRYWTDRRDIPMMDQGLYSRGPVIIEDDVWVAAGVRILDGVHVGRGSVIGAGAVIQQDVPPYSVVMPHQKHVTLPRSLQGD